MIFYIIFEKNRIVYQDDIFILMKDILWANDKKDDIYLLALPEMNL